MWRLLKFLWTGSWHEHQWETVQKGKLWGDDEKMPTGDYYILRCKHCGDYKQRKLR